MILADTSVWIDFLRNGNAELRDLLDAGQIVMHDFVLGELACGNLQDRKTNLAWFSQLPKIQPATNEEVLYLVTEAKLYCRRLGWVDMHLLAATRLAHVRLFTRNEPLRKAALEFNVAYETALV
jgi:predicted nucleic acid-binding protein